LSVAFHRWISEIAGKGRALMVHVTPIAERV